MPDVPTITLWHLRPSHYSEKVRWALDLKRISHIRRMPIPGVHMAAALWLTRGGHFTLPVIELDRRAVGDSTAILAALEERFPDPPLYPADADDRARALALEEWLDEQLGRSIRTMVFHALRGDPDRFDAVGAQALPELFRRSARIAGAYGRAFTGVRYGARRDDAAERAREQVVAALDRLERELDGRPYLVGDRFTVADLTAAALFYPLVLPPEGPIRMDSVPDSLGRLQASLEQRDGYRWLREIWRRHRRHHAA